MILVIVHQGWHHVLEPRQSYSDHLKCSHNSIILPEAVWQFQWGGVPEWWFQLPTFEKVSLLPLLGPEGNFSGRELFKLHGSTSLVGGWTNPSEKYSSNWIISPILGVKIKIFELPPSSSCWNTISSQSNLPWQTAHTLPIFSLWITCQFLGGCWILACH